MSDNIIKSVSTYHYHATLNALCAPGSVLRVVQAWSHLIVITACGSCYLYHQFPEKESETVQGPSPEGQAWFEVTNLTFNLCALGKPIAGKPFFLESSDLPPLKKQTTHYFSVSAPPEGPQGLCLPGSGRKAELRSWVGVSSLGADVEPPILTEVICPCPADKWLP